MFPLEVCEPGDFARTGITQNLWFGVVWQPQIGPPRLWKSPEENPTVSYRAILAGVRVPLC